MGRMRDVINEQLLDVRQFARQWLINTLALFAAVSVIPGMHFAGPGWQMGIVALCFGLMSTVIRPVLVVLTLPLVIFSLGLFVVIINAALLVLTSMLAQSMQIVFTIDTFWDAFFGSLVISLVSLLLGILTGDQRFRVKLLVGRTPPDDDEPK